MPVINISLPRPDRAGINLERVTWTHSITAHVVWLYLIGCVLMIIIAVYEGLLGSWARAERLRVRRAEIRERGERARALAPGTPEPSFIRTVGAHGDDGCLGQPPFETTPLLSVNAATAGRDQAWSYRSVALSGLSGSTEISPVEEEANGPQSTKFQLPPPSSSRKNGPPRRSSFSL